LAENEEDAVKYAAKIGYPVVMKIMSEDIVHKFDVGGVVLDIKDSSQAKTAYKGIINSVSKKQPDARIKGVLVTKMVPKGQEIILGVKRDPSFESVIMFGMGGIFVEIFKDVRFRIAPVDELSARNMINETKSSAILQGARGNVISDISAITDAIQRLSKLASDCPQIRELDINPLIVLEKGKGCFIADAKIMLNNK
jgi:succinyl-CoA synthetase beta subunit